jgi:hypothetical protein
VFLVSPLVCIFVGSILGTAAFVALGTASGGGAEFVRAYPMFILYSFPITVPFGGVAGLAAGVIITKLGAGSFRHAGLGRWVRVGCLAGLAIGAACPLLLVLIGFGGASVTDQLFYVTTGAVSGSVAGGVLGVLGWREFSAQPQIADATQRERKVWTSRPTRS